MASRSKPSADAGPCPRSPLTRLQLETLRKLSVLSSTHPRHQDGGFNAISFGGERFAAAARRLALDGLVRVERVSQRHYRYAITPKGRAAHEAARNASPQGNSGTDNNPSEIEEILQQQVIP